MSAQCPCATRRCHGWECSPCKLGSTPILSVPVDGRDCELTHTSKARGMRGRGLRVLPCRLGSTPSMTWMVDGGLGLPPPRGRGCPTAHDGTMAEKALRCSCCPCDLRCCFLSVPPVIKRRKVCVPTCFNEIFQLQSGSKGKDVPAEKLWALSSSGKPCAGLNRGGKRALLGSVHSHAESHVGQDP